MTDEHYWKPFLDKLTNNIDPNKMPQNLAYLRKRHCPLSLHPYKSVLDIPRAVVPYCCDGSVASCYLIFITPSPRLSLFLSLSLSVYLITFNVVFVNGSIFRLFNISA